MIKVKGLLHVHSFYSFDAKVALERLKLMVKERGLQFLCISEHTDELTEEKFHEMVNDCRRLSDEKCLFVPGLEITCEDGTHLLALGLEKWVQERDLIELAKAQRENNTLFVIAHPSHRVLSKLLRTPVLQQLDGIEVWNRKYNGLMAPNPDCLQALHTIQRIHPQFLGFCGVDFHEEEDRFSPTAIVSVPELSRTHLMSALKRGSFSVQGPGFSFLPTGVMNLQERIKLSLYHYGRTVIYKSLKWIKWNVINRWIPQREVEFLEKKLKQYL